MSDFALDSINHPEAVPAHVKALHTLHVTARQTVSQALSPQAVVPALAVPMIDAGAPWAGRSGS